MNQYGETIYGTRGGDMAPQPWGVSTRKGDRLFVHVLDLNEDTFYIPLKGKKVKSVTKFIDKTPVSFKREKNGILVTLTQVPDEVDCVLELALSEK